MRIRELQLFNYRPFPETEPFQFSDQFTVIAGVNGRGKTAILDGLALILGRLLPHISPARSGYRPIFPSDIHQQAPSVVLNVKVNCVRYPIEYQLTYERENRKLSTTRLPPALKREVRNAYGDPNRADDAAPLVVYYTTDRAGYRLPKNLPAEVPRGQAAAYAGALFNRTVNFRDFMARYRTRIAIEEEEIRDNPSFLGDRAVRAIEETLRTFLEGFSNLRILENPLRLVIDKAGVPLDLTQLSDGERSFLALICDLGRRLALANPMMANPLEGYGVVLIDEIELHLHPKWQREVVEKLRRTFPNIQFIATTHSPFIVQSLHHDELILLDDLIVGDYENKGLEEVTTKVMGIEDPNVTPRYLEMLNAAKEYFQLLEQPPVGDEGALAALKRRLDQLVQPYADNPAYQAFLEMHRVRAFRE